MRPRNHIPRRQSTTAMKLERAARNLRLDKQKAAKFSSERERLIAAGIIIPR